MVMRFVCKLCENYFALWQSVQIVALAWRRKGALGLPELLS